MTIDEALEWAQQQWEERPPQPLTAEQYHAVTMFGRLRPRQAHVA